MQWFVSAVKCSKAMVKRLNITAPVVMITDNTWLRSLIADGHLEVGAVRLTSVGRPLHGRLVSGLLA